ncbi:MAG: hypothetical protein ACUVRH_05105 [Candidatus Bipolaricaulia bacterium]
MRAGSLIMPWDWRSYVNERFSEEEDFHKRTELACELIRSFAPPVKGRVILLVESAYCCAEVIWAAHQRGFPMVGWVKKKRRASTACWLMGDGLGMWRRRR